MKKLCLIVLCLISLKSLAQTTAWSSSPVVTQQTRLFNGLPQIRSIWSPDNIFNYVPNIRTLTINGTLQDLSADRNWTVTPAGSAGGDLIGSYPNPIVNTINGITKSYYDPISSIQTQLDGKQASLGYTPENVANKGANNGYAGLDAGGKISFSNLPASIYIVKGTWDASTNTPTLANGTGVSGWIYQASVGGTVNFGAGNITFSAGDYVGYNGSIWQWSPGTSAVRSVDGFQGVVNLSSTYQPLENQRLSNSNNVGFVNGLFSGSLSASNLSGTNTGDETTSRINALYGYTPANGANYLGLHATADNSTLWNGSALYTGGFASSVEYAMVYDGTNLRIGVAYAAQMQAFLGLGSAAYTSSSSYYPISGNPSAFSTYSFTGSGSQYTKGDGTYGAFPTDVSSFTNDIGYLTGITGSQVNSALGYTAANDVNVVHNSGTETIGGNKTTSDLWQFDILTGHYNNGGLNAPIFANNEGSWSLTNNYSNGGSETDLWLNHGIGAVGGLRIYDVGSGLGSENQIFDLNGATGDARIFGNFAINTVQHLPSSAPYWLTQDLGTNDIAYRSAAETGSDLSPYILTGAYSSVNNTVTTKIPIVVDGTTYYILASTSSL